ncbi:MAG TPA: MFS transporter [Phaeodactylibacter sp.]|nr:MFS transporter [Phaeodactylibacter sp.]
MKKSESSKAPLGIIFLTVLFDMIGLGIVIPVIPALFFDREAGFFTAAVGDDTISIIYGLLIGSYPLMQFFGAPILGNLSDRYGRKPVLSLSLVGTFIGYFLFAVAIWQQNLPLLFVSRMLPGFMGGNISIVYSALADVSTPEQKAGNFGLVGAAFGIGFIIGPALGGVLADPEVYSGFSYITPFIFTGFLTILNLLLVQWRFPETLKERKRTPVKPWSGLTNLAKAFTYSNLRSIFTVSLLLSLGFAFFTQFFAVYLIQRFQYEQRDIGFLYAWIGLWLVITQGVIVRRLGTRFLSSQLLSVTILLLSFALAALLLPAQSHWFYVINPLIAIFQGITSPNLTAIISNLVGLDRQGEILGIQQSMRSLGTAVPPIIAGWLNALDSRYPVMAAALLVLIAWLVYFFIFRPSNE